MEDIFLSSVVKILSQNIDFDWFDPYKTSNNNESLGTGFFIDDKGTILTCAHVIDTAVKVNITVPNDGRKKIEAEIISLCPMSDLALLRVINYKNKSFLKFGSSDKLKQRDKVIAIGYPLGQKYLKFTEGIISGFHGSLIQTDAPINSGNSGGPLVNINNEVIGINSEKIASWAADNIGYAVPSYDFLLIKDLMYNAQKNKKIIPKPIIACTFQKSDNNMIKYYINSDKCTEGYFIRSIVKTSPLYEAGVRNGDFLCEFDKYKIDNYGEIKISWTNEKIIFYEILNRYKISDKVSIKYWSTKKKEIIETIMEFNNAYPLKIRHFNPLFEKVDYVVFGGIVVMNLTLNHLKKIYSRIESDEIYNILKTFIKKKNRLKNRLIITSILPSSIIKDKEIIQVGSIIKSINGIKVNTLDEYKKALLNVTSVNNKKYLIIRTESNNIQVLNVEKLLMKEVELSKLNKYKLSDIYEKYKNGDFIIIDKNKIKKKIFNKILKLIKGKNLNKIDKETKKEIKELAKELL